MAAVALATGYFTLAAIAAIAAGLVAIWLEERRILRLCVTWCHASAAVGSVGCGVSYLREPPADWAHDRAAHTWAWNRGNWYALGGVRVDDDL